jgi:hypothetical protein
MHQEGAMVNSVSQRFKPASKCRMAIIPLDGKMTRVIDGRPATLRNRNRKWIPSIINSLLI